ncbi:MAG: hypothetical protein AAB932_00395 [Patescibacteria group bacterium]
MAKNAPKGPGRRGSVKKRYQVYNPKTKRWTKASSRTKKFVDQKADKKHFRGVRRKKKKT